MSAALVTLDAVDLSYHTKRAETHAIENLNMKVYAGEFVSLVGPSGCGKTTALSLIMGLIPPSGGSVWAGGLKMGYMLQRDQLLPWRTVEKNVLLGLEVQRSLSRESRARAMELLSTYGLGDFARHLPAQLSGGMRQKVALIRTLATEPELLLLDEPFSALDYQTRLRVADEVYDIIKRENKTAILVTHDISEAVSMSDRVLVFSCRPATVKAEFAIRFPKGLSPLARRNEAGFQDYFQQIWREMDV